MFEICDQIIQIRNKINVLPFVLWLSPTFFEFSFGKLDIFFMVSPAKKASFDSRGGRVRPGGSVRIKIVVPLISSPPKKL